MKAIILAAGIGNRISKNIDGIPKSFLLINDKKIIDHQITALRENGIKEIIIVTGYKSELFEEYYFNDNDIKLIKNPFYKHCNVLGSLWFARDFIDDDIIFLHADTIFEKEILSLLIQNRSPISLAVEFKKTNKEEMKVKVKNNLILEINKTMKCSDANGEFTGIAKINRLVSQEVRHLIVNFVEKENQINVFFEVVLQKIIDLNMFDISAVDIQKYKSIEIDFIEDYKLALKLF